MWSFGSASWLNFQLDDVHQKKHRSGKPFFAVQFMPTATK